MKQKQARKVVNSLKSLYPLQDFEMEAIDMLLIPKEKGWLTYKECEACPNCKQGYQYLNAKFCWNCGQPLSDE